LLNLKRSEHLKVNTAALKWTAFAQWWNFMNVVLNWIGHILRRNCLLKHVIEGKLEGRIEMTGR
jgi:hypothetical protein